MVADERSQKNPILQENIKVLEQRIRKAPEISDSYKDQNDKRYLRENNKPRPERVNYEDNYVKRNVWFNPLIIIEERSSIFQCQRMFPRDP